MLTTVNYEKIEITPNGTTIEVPANQTKFNGDYESVKIWNWNNTKTFIPTTMLLTTLFPKFKT